MRCDLRTAVVTASPDGIPRITSPDVTALITLCKPVTMADNGSNKQEDGHASHRRSGSSLRSKSSRPAVGQSLARTGLRHRRGNGRCHEQCRRRRRDHGVVVQRLSVRSELRARGLQHLSGQIPGRDAGRRDRSGDRRCGGEMGGDARRARHSHPHARRPADGRRPSRPEPRFRCRRQTWFACQFALLGHPGQRPAAHPATSATRSS